MIFFIFLMNSCVMHAFKVDKDKIDIVKINRYNYKAIKTKEMNEL